MKIKSICIITNKYPNHIEPNVLVFVQQLIWEFAEQGISCVVICPMPVNLVPQYFRMPFMSKEKTDKGKIVLVYRPKYIGWGQSTICGFNPAGITTSNFTEAVRRVLKSEQINPDILYSHFITPSGIAAARIGRDFGIPAFMGYGEASYNTIKNFGGSQKVRHELEFLSGIVAVASSSKDMLVRTGVAEADIIGVFPNSYNPLRFRPSNREKARDILQLPQKDFIVGFVGSFDDRKGVMRLQHAVDSLEGVKFICAGDGKQKPTSMHCLYSGPVNHDKLVYFYNSCDLFVLPTRHEGCCNAIIEAMACGLPIVSSNKSFNDDILDDTNSLRIDPEDIEDIANAIERLRDDLNLRLALGSGSLKKAADLTLDKRARRIVEFMEGKISSLNL